MKRIYWMKNGDFANTYDVRYCESREQEAIAEERGYTRVTREVAINAVRAERKRRKEGGAFNGFAPTHIAPMAAETQDWQNYPWRKQGYFIEKG